MVRSIARSGASICRIEPGLVHRPVLLAHLARDRVEIGLVRVVVRVQHRGRDDAGRRRGHEPLGERAELAGDLVEARGLVGDRLQVDIFDVGLRFGRVLLTFGRIRKSPHHIGEQVRELLELAAAAALRYAGEAGHALRHVGLEANPALLAVVADVDARVHLSLDDMADRLVLFIGHRLGVDGLALVLRHQQVGQLFVARQAADVGGENAVAAEDHGVRLRSDGSPSTDIAAVWHRLGG